MATSPSRSSCCQSSLTGTWVMVGVHFALWMTFFFVLVAIVPGFEESFRDHDMTLPNLTITVLQVEHLFSDNWYLAVLVVSFLVGVHAVVLVLLRHLAGWRKGAQSWFVVSCVVPLLAIAWEVTGMLVVYVKALEVLSR